MLMLRDLTLELGKRRILDGVTLTLRPHRLTALVGRNGSGKSSLLACVNQERPYKGQILEGERDLALLPPRERARRIAYLPQSLPAPHITAEEMVALGRNPHLDFTGRLHDCDRQAVEQALADADARSLAGRYMDTLSGGERQRVALAMILAQNTPIALLDEPTAHMDLYFQAAFLHRLREIKNAKKKTFLVVLHDLAAAMEFADDVVVLEQGRLCFSGTREQCLEAGILEKSFGLERHTTPQGKLFWGAGQL